MAVGILAKRLGKLTICLGGLPVNISEGCKGMLRDSKVPFIPSQNLEIIINFYLREMCREKISVFQLLWPLPVLPLPGE